LAVVSKTVEENRGRIEIESREGEGTVCRLRLPVAAEAVVEQVV
jgi:chemotaxis protein histidine kinase CheA